MQNFCLHQDAVSILVTLVCSAVVPCFAQRVEHSAPKLGNYENFGSFGKTLDPLKNISCKQSLERHLRDDLRNLKKASIYSTKRLVPEIIGWFIWKIIWLKEIKWPYTWSVMDPIILNSEKEDTTGSNFSIFNLPF